MTTQTATGTSVTSAGPPANAPRHDIKVVKALQRFAMSITVFNILGYTVLGFEQPWLWPFLALAVGYSAEISIELVTAAALKRRPAFLGNGAWGVYTFLLPTHITTLAANMLLYANDKFWPII